jgi:hypothetical protein
MKQFIAADFTGMSVAQVETMLAAARLDPATDRIIVLGPFGTLELAQHFAEQKVAASERSDQLSVVVIPSGEADRVFFSEINEQHAADRARKAVTEEIFRSTDTVRSIPLEGISDDTKRRISLMTYEGFEILTGVTTFAKVKELIQTSHLAPHAFLSIIRPLYIASQDASQIWIVQPMPDSENEYIHHRRLLVFAGDRARTESTAKVVTLNKQEGDLGICHSYDMLIQHPQDASHLAENHDRAYEKILSFVTPSPDQIAAASKGQTHCNLLADGFSHLITLGRACQGHFALLETRYRQRNDLNVEFGLPLVSNEQNGYVPGIAFFNIGAPLSGENQNTNEHGSPLSPEQ